MGGLLVGIVPADQRNYRAWNCGGLFNRVVFLREFAQFSMWSPVGRSEHEIWGCWWQSLESRYTTKLEKNGNLFVLCGGLGPRLPSLNTLDLLQAFVIHSCGKGETKQNKANKPWQQQNKANKPWQQQKQTSGTIILSTTATETLHTWWS